VEAESLQREVWMPKEGRTEKGRGGSLHEKKKTKDTLARRQGGHLKKKRPAQEQSEQKRGNKKTGTLSVKQGKTTTKGKR